MLFPCEYESVFAGDLLLSPLFVLTFRLSKGKLIR